MAPVVIGKSQSRADKVEVWKYRLRTGIYTINKTQKTEIANARRSFLFENKYFPNAFPKVRLERRLAYCPKIIETNVTVIALS